MNANYRHAYKLLNLPRSSDWQKAKTNYRRLVQTWHPDKFDTNSAESSHAHEKFLEINNAYDLLHAFYRENQKLPLEPETLSDTDFTILRRSQTTSLGTSTSPRKRHRRKNNKGTASKLSFVIGLVIVIFLIVNSSNEATGPVNIEGDIWVEESSVNTSSTGSGGWNHQLGGGSSRDAVLGTNRANVGDSLDGRLFERRR